MDDAVRLQDSTGLGNNVKITCCLYFPIDVFVAREKGKKKRKKRKKDFWSKLAEPDGGWTGH
jgi:hypothetical protein